MLPHSLKHSLVLLGFLEVFIGKDFLPYQVLLHLHTPSIANLSTSSFLNFVRRPTGVMHDKEMVLTILHLFLYESKSLSCEFLHSLLVWILAMKRRDAKCKHY